MRCQLSKKVRCTLYIELQLKLPILLNVIVSFQFNNTQQYHKKPCKKLMGICCIKSQPDNKIENHKQSLIDQSPADQLDFSQSTPFNEKFTAFLNSFSIDQLLKDYEKQQSECFAVWISNHSQRISELNQKLDDYLEKLNKEDSQLRNVIREDISKLNKYANEVKSHTRQRTFELNAEAKPVLLKIQFQKYRLPQNSKAIQICTYLEQKGQIELFDQSEISLKKAETSVKVQKSKGSQQRFDSQFVEILTTNQHYLSFKLSPTNQFSRYYVNEFLQQSQSLLNLSIKLNSPTTSKSQNQAQIAARTQIFTLQGLEQLRLQIKSIRKCLEYCQKGDSNWNDLQSLRNSFISSQNDSSFGSLFDRS